MRLPGVSEISESVVVSLVGEDFWGVSLVDMVGSCGCLGGGVEGFWMLVRVMHWGVGVDEEAVLEGPDASVVAPVGIGF